MAEYIEVKDVIEEVEILAAIKNVSLALNKLGQDLLNVKRAGDALNPTQNQIIKQNLELQAIVEKSRLTHAKYIAELEKVRAKLAQADLANKKAADATDNYSAKVKKATTDTNTWSKALDSFQTKFNSIGNIVGEVFSRMLSGVKSFSRAVYEQVKLIDSLNFAYKAIIPSNIELSATYKRLDEIAEKHGINISDLKEQYLRFAAATRGTSLEGNKAMDIFEKVSKSMSLMGLSSEKQKDSFRALTEMMSKGTIMAQELKIQLGNALPGAFKIMADSMGVSTAQLQKMLEKGGIMASEVLPNFANQLVKAYGADSVEMINTLAAAEGRLSSEFDKFKQSITGSENLSYWANTGREALIGLRFILEEVKGIVMTILAPFGVVIEEFINLISIWKIGNGYGEQFVKTWENWTTIGAEGLNKIINPLGGINKEYEKIAINLEKVTKSQEEYNKSMLDFLNLDKTDSNVSGVLMTPAQIQYSIDKLEEYIATIKDEIDYAKARGDEKVAIIDLEITGLKTKRNLFLLEKRDAKDLAEIEKEIKIKELERERELKNLKDKTAKEEQQNLDKLNKLKEKNSGKTELQNIGEIAKANEKKDDIILSSSIRLLMQTQDARLKQEAAEEKAHRQRLQNINDIADAVQGLSDLQQGLFSRELSNLQEKNAKEMDARKEQEDSQLLALDIEFGKREKLTGRALTYEKRKQDILKETRELQAKHEREEAEVKTKMAKWEKANSLMQILFNTSVAILAAWKNPLTTPLTIPLISTTSALQFAAVAATPIPKYWKGGKNLEGMAIVGDRYGEELIKTKDGKTYLTPNTPTQVMLPKGSEVIPNKDIYKHLGQRNIDITALVEEQKLTRRAIENKPNFEINQKGLSKFVQIGNARINFVDTYFRK